MKSSTEVVTLDDYITAFSKTMALELIKLVDDQGKQRGEEVRRRIVLEFLAGFVSGAVCRVLEPSVQEGATNEQRYAAVSESFSSHKRLMQEAIAAGFTASMSQFSGRSVEYYCQIKIVPEIVNKSIN